MNMKPLTIPLQAFNSLDNGDVSFDELYDGL